MPINKSITVIDRQTVRPPTVVSNTGKNDHTAPHVPITLHGHQHAQLIVLCPRLSSAVVSF